MRWLLASGSYFHRGEDGTRSVIEHVETILTLPIFVGRAAEARVSVRVKYCFTRRSWRHRKERGRKTKAQRGKERGSEKEDSLGRVHAEARGKRVGKSPLQLQSGQISGAETNDERTKRSARERKRERERAREREKGKERDEGRVA